MSGQGFTFQNGTGILGNLTALIPYLMGSRTNGSLNSTLFVLRKQACDEDMLQKWLSFSNVTAAHNLQTQLCNLTLQEGMELLQDFRDALDANKTLQEAWNCNSFSVDIIQGGKFKSFQNISFSQKVIKTIRK